MSTDLHRRAIERVLDDPATLSAVSADPVGALRDLPAPVLVDEFQRVPAVLDVVSRV